MAAGFVHHGMGYRTEWEDVFCTAFGANWRSTRDTCSTLCEWRALRHNFVNSVCSHWGLPVIKANPTGQDLEATVPAAPRTKRHKGSFSCFDNGPTAHGEHAPQIEFWRSSNCITFVVDCKPVADIVCGHVPLRTDSLFPVYERLTSTIFEFMPAGWTPATRIADPVLWHRRENNQIADFLANFTMEVGESWLKEIAPMVPNVSLCEAIIICHSDGGTRKDSCVRPLLGSSTRVWSENITGTRFHVHSFTAESVALGDVASYVSRKILNRCSGQHKRIRLA